MRLTIDLDTKQELNPCLRKINDLFGYIATDEVWRSSSGRGYHVIIYGLKITFKRLQALRVLLNDDARRVYIDNIRDKQGHATQVLFTEKAGKKAVLMYDRKRKINKFGRITSRLLA